MLVFGPVPSRRLGRSLGINNIPPKACSYSCVYCQVGLTQVTEIVPRIFYKPERILDELQTNVSQVQAQGEKIDYLTFVSDGEPSLDARLGETIQALRPLGIPIAIISNASLIWREDVRDTLTKADWVSLKVDAIDDLLWRRINRPHASLDHGKILDGMLDFAEHFEGTLATESMLVLGLNDNLEAANELAIFLEKLAPAVSYLSVPTRPPAEKQVRVPNEAALNLVYQIVSQRMTRVELMTGYEGNAFASSGNITRDLLSITSVHPMREEAVQELLTKAGAEWKLVEKLIDQHQLIQTKYEGLRYYVRHLK